MLKRLAALLGTVLMVGGCGDGGGAQTAAADPGEQTYNRFCFSCHQSGAAGAPRLGDAAAWGARLEKGEDALLASTINGIPPGMPARGLCMQCSDEELAAAIGFMLANSQ